MPETWTVLIVDDSPEDRREVRRQLLRGSDRQYRFAEAETATEARQRLAQVDTELVPAPNAIILDFNLPDATALDLLPDLCAADGAPRYPILVLTGSVGPSVGAAALRAGAQDFLGKSSMTPEVLTRALENACERFALAHELRESERRFRRAADATGALVYEVDLRAGHRAFVHGMERVVGELPDSGSSFDSAWWHARIHEDDRQAHLDALTHMLASGTGPYQWAYRVQHADGRWIHVEDTGQVMRDEHGTPERLVGTIVDVSERTVAEQALRTRHRQLDFLARAAQRLLSETEPDAALLTPIFGELAELLGYDSFYHYRLRDDDARLLRLDAYGGITADEARLFGTMRMGDPLCGIVAKCRARLLVEDLQHVSRPGSEALRAAGVTSYVGFPLLTHDDLIGTVAFVSHSRTHLREGDLQVIETTCDHVATAIERARLASEVRNSEEHLRRVIEAMHIFVGVLTPDGTMVECNAAPVRAAGQQREDVIGVHFADSYWWAYSEASQARIRADIVRAASGEAVRYDAPVRVRGSDGQPTFIDVDFALTPLRDAAGTVTHLVPIGIDISARTRVEVALRDADRQKDEFIAVLAHELRNPLAPIRTSMGVLKARDTADPAIARCRDIIERQVAHMARLLDDLLDVSRLSRGTLTLQRAPVRLEDVIAQAAEAVEGLIEGRGHTLTIAPIDPAIVLDADAARLTQILTNLLNNAAKYTDHGGAITVRTTRTDGQVAVHVQDTGIGLDPTMRNRIFDLFTQIEDARTRSEGGLGIGLGLTKRLVEMHGGTIVVDSPGLGRGATFTVVLPLRAGASGAPESARPVESRRALLERRRVLVVDDNADAADTMAMLLETLGCETRTVYNGTAALQEAQRFHPDLVLLDLGMPGLDGQTVCRQLRGEGWGMNMVIAAVTGWGQEDDRRRTKISGFDHHLVKPVAPDMLEQLLRELPQQHPM